MTLVGGLGVHRQQITFDYVDSNGLVAVGAGPSGNAGNVAALTERALC